MSVKITPGTCYTKHGVDVIVHFLKDGQVFGVKYREGGSDASLFLPPDEYEIPADFLGTFRMPIVEFQAAVQDARVTAVGEAP